MATFDETVEKLNQTTEKLDKAIDKMNAPDPLDKEDASEAETRREEDKDRKTNNEYLRVIADGISNSGTTVKVDGKKGGFGLIGGLLTGIGSAVAGAGLAILGPAMVGLAAGFTALGLASKMITLAGLAIGGFIASVGAGTWIFGQGAKAFGQGLKDTAAGVEELDRVGKKIDNKNLIAVGDGLKKFLESTASMKSFFGAVITFLTGDLPKIADGLEKFNKLDIDKQKMTDAGQGLNAFMSAMGEGSFFGKLMGSISTVIVPDLKNLADGVGKLSDVSKGLDLQKFLDMATGIGELNDPLLRLSKTGFTTNFVGKGALSDIADGVTALNKAEVNRLKEVSTAMGNLDENMFEIVKTGFVANFVGKGAIKDIADGAKHLATQLGTQGILNQSLLAAKSMGVMKESLSTFTSGNLWNSLKGVGESLLNFISGSNSPIEKIAEVARNSTDLEKGANAIDKIGTGLEKLSKMNFDGRTFKLAEFAEDLKNSIPDIEAAINGGEIGGTMGFAKTTIKGLGSTDLKLDTAVANVAKLKSVMGSLSPTPVAVTPSGSGGGNDLWQSKLLKTLDTLSSQMGGGATVLNQVNKGGDSVVTTNNTQMPSLSLNNPQGPSPMR